MKQLGGEFVAEFFTAERGLWKTFLELTVRPGRTARNYLDGKRKRYTSPLLWYALCAAALLLGLWFMQEPVTNALVEGLSEEYFAKLRSAGIEAPEQWAIDRYMLVIQSSYTWLGLIAFVLPMALVLRVVLGAKHNLAETLVVSLFCISHMMLFTGATGQILTRISPNLYFWVSQGMYDIYAVLTIGTCYGWKWRNVLGGLLAIVIASLSFYYTIRTLLGLALTTAF